MLFPTHTIKNFLLPLLQTFSDVIAVEPVDLELGEKEAALLLAKEPGSAGHRGVGRLKQVLQETQLTSPGN